MHLIFQGAALNYGQLTFCNHIKCNCSSFPVIKKLHYWCKFFAFEMVNVSRIYIHEIHGCDAIPGNYKPPHHSLCSIKGYNQVRVSLIQIILILILLLRRSKTNWTWKNAQYKVTRFQNLKDKILTWKEEEKTNLAYQEKMWRLFFWGSPFKQVQQWRQVIFEYLFCG